MKRYFSHDRWTNFYAGSWFVNLWIQKAKLEILLERPEVAWDTICDIEYHREHQDLSTGWVKETRPEIVAIKGAYYITMARKSKTAGEPERAWMEQAIRGTNYLGRAFRSYDWKRISLQGELYAIKQLASGLELIVKTPVQSRDLRTICLEFHSYDGVPGYD